MSCRAHPLVPNHTLSSPGEARTMHLEANSFPKKRKELIIRGGLSDGVSNLVGLSEHYACFYFHLAPSAPRTGLFEISFSGRL